MFLSLILCLWRIIMALIKCLECGKDVSDKAKMCVHCGYPIASEHIKNMICNVNGVQYDLTNIYNRIMVFKKNNGNPDIHHDNTYKTIFNDIYKLTHLVKSAKLCDEIFETEKIPISFNGEIHVPTQKPQCPTCKSANIRKISATKRTVSIVGLGILSKNINKTFECLNCGYRW